MSRFQAPRRLRGTRAVEGDEKPMKRMPCSERAGNQGTPGHETSPANFVQGTYAWIAPDEPASTAPWVCDAGPPVAVFMGSTPLTRLPG